MFLGQTFLEPVYIYIYMDLLKITYVLLLPEEVFLINNMYLPGMASNFPSYIYIYIYIKYTLLSFSAIGKRTQVHILKSIQTAHSTSNKLTTSHKRSFSCICKAENY